jgi:hypothetical protein
MLTLCHCCTSTPSTHPPLPPLPPPPPPTTTTTCTCTLIHHNRCCCHRLQEKPKHAPSSSSDDKPSLSIDSGSQLMKIGTAVDWGICKGIRKDGARCSKGINTSLGEYCDYHVQAVFKQKMNVRMDLNRTFMPSGVSRDKHPKGTGNPKVRRAQPTTVSADTLAKQSKSHLFMRVLQAKAEKDAQAVQKVAQAAQRAAEKANGERENTLLLLHLHP